MAQVRYKVFGKENWPTVYYFTGYGTMIKKFSPYTLTLVMVRFRIFAFEYDKTFLLSGDPNTLVHPMV